MVTICNCKTCQEIKKNIKERTINPKCTYCGKYHNNKLACPEYLAYTYKKKEEEFVLDNLEFVLDNLKFVLDNLKKEKINGISN